MRSIIDKIQAIQGETLSSPKIKLIKDVYTILKLIHQTEVQKLQNLARDSPNTKHIQIRAWIVELLHGCITDEYIYLMMLNDQYFSVIENVYYYIRTKLSIKYHLKRWMRDTMEWMVLEYQFRKKMDNHPLHDRYLNALIIPNYWQFMYQNIDARAYLKQMELKTHYHRYHEIMDQITSFKDRIEHLFTFYFPYNSAMFSLFYACYDVLLAELSEHFFDRTSDYWDWSQEDAYFSIVYNELLQMDFMVIDEYMSIV